MMLFTFFWILLLAGTFFSSASVSSDNTVAPSDSLKDRGNALCREIKKFAMNQLGLEDGKNRNLSFSDYIIYNWPIFVPFNPKNWDEQALIDLKDALPKMVFTEKPEEYKDTSAPRSAHLERSTNRRLILDMLLARYNQQTGKSANRISWISYHLKGWPRGVSLRPDHWNCGEVLAVYRHLDYIRFEPILPGEKRTITYFDEEDVESEEEYADTHDLDSEDENEHEMIGKEQFEEEEQGEESKDEENMVSESFETSSSRINLGTLLVRNTEESTGSLSSAGVNEPSTFDSHIEKESESLASKDDNDSCSEAFGSLSERALDLYRDIKVFAINQLDFQGSYSEFCFSDYHVINWPLFVAFRPSNWDEQALIDLRAALPTLIFSEKPQGSEILTQTRKAELDRIVKRRLLLDLLLGLYRQQTYDPSIKRRRTTRIYWYKYHISGWPRGISFRPDRWNCDEILRVYRHLNQIEFKPILPGEERTVTYADEISTDSAIADSDSEAESESIVYRKRRRFDDSESNPN